MKSFTRQNKNSNQQQPENSLELPHVSSSVTAAPCHVQTCSKAAWSTAVIPESWNCSCWKSSRSLSPDLNLAAMSLGLNETQLDFGSHPHQTLRLLKCSNMRLPELPGLLGTPCLGSQEAPSQLCEQAGEMPHTKSWNH